MKNSQTVDEKLSDLHEAVTDALLGRVKSGEASASDMMAAIKFLKDNNISSNPEPGDKIDQLKEALPKFEDEETY